MSVDRPGRVVRIKHESYQPSKAEREADVSLDVTATELVRAVVTPVTVIKEQRERKGRGRKTQRA